MDRQALFDKVWQHFVVEGHPKAATEDGICYYFGPNGERCAIGIQLPDELAKKLPNERILDVLKSSDISNELRAALGMSTFEMVPNIALVTDGEFLRDLQLAHDWAARPALDPMLPWRTVFAITFVMLARRYYLEVPQPLVLNGE